MDPCVVPVNGKYHLYYCGGGRKTKNGKLECLDGAVESLEEMDDLFNAQPKAPA
jgi:hypothetical protein